MKRILPKHQSGALVFTLFFCMTLVFYYEIHNREKWYSNRHTVKKLVFLHAWIFEYKKTESKFPKEDLWNVKLEKFYREAENNHLSKECFRDEWGQEIVYKVPGSINKNSFDIYSKGPNQQDDNGEVDDIGNWGDKNNSAQSYWDNIRDVVLQFGIKHKD